MKTITVKVGAEIRFDVPVRGEPPPEMVWKFKGADMKTDSRLHVS